MKNDKMGPVQGFAFGGIANPTQRATLRPSDRAYLEARQRELDAYERQRLAYNKALEEYQSREQTEEFGMAAPVLPFKEAEVAARQQQAAQRARRDAGNRATAISVVSDPERFGFGSMSIADRFMAKGGEVRGYAEGGEADEDDEEGVGEVGSAKALLAQLEAQAPRRASRAPAPKRMAARSDGAAMPKGMGMEQESLGSVRELVKMATEKGSARQQMEELARLYQIKISAAQNRSRGMAASTFGAPTLETPTMTKNTLATKRFAGGGEVSGVPSNGFVTGRPIEFSGSPYSQYTTDFVTAKPMKIPAPTYLASYGSQSGEVVDPNPEWSRLTNEQKTQYYQERPKEAALARAGQALFGLTSAGNLQRMFAPEFVREQEKVVGGPLFNRAGLASGFSNFFMGAPQSPAPVIDMSTVREPAPIESVPRSTAPVIDMSTVRGPAPIQSGPTTDQGTGYASDYGTASYGGEQYGDMPAGTYAEGGEVKALNRRNGSPESGEITDPEAALVEGRGDVPAPARNKVLDEILGAGETALTLGTGAAASLAGMPYGLYKGLTSGKYLEGKAADIAGKEAAAFMERNTYQPRTESAQENLAALAKIADKMKWAPAPGGAAIASIPRTAALAQAERLGMAAEKKLEGPVTRTMERGGKAADLLSSFRTQPSRVVPSTPAPATQPSRVAPPTGSVKTPAPASELGFYSAAEQAALNLPRKEGTGAAFLNDLMKAPDVKKEELSAMGLDEFLKSKPKATRQEVQDFIANNRFDVKEVQFGNLHDMAVQKEQKAAGNLVDLINAQEGASIRLANTQGKVFSDEALYALQDGTSVPSQFPPEFQSAAKNYLNAYDATKETSNTYTKFGQYQLPGGENYREILLTIPSKKPQPVTSADDPRVRIEGSEAQGWEVLVDGRTVQSYKPGVKESSVRDYALADANEAIERRATRDQYKSSHFDEPNILAHLRVNDRVDADGKKMLLIEELQSDWHQTGREKGYGPKMDKSVEAYYETKAGQRIPVGFGKTKEEAEASIDIGWKDLVDIKYETVERKIGEGVPDAPFKDTWHQLALKRALKYAADNGYDRVGLTTGKQQAQRYNLSKQVDNISYEPTEKGFYINVISKEGQNVLKGDYSARELEGMVGKEITQKMLGKQGANEFDPKVEPDLANVKTLTGVDLQVGGEGMKKYYDEIYPGFLAKQAKKYGSQVGETSIKTQTSAPAYVDYFVGPGRFNATAVLGVRADGTTEIINQTPNSLRAAQQLANRYKEKHLGGGKEAVRYIDITPEMKGAVPYAKGGPVDKNTAFIKAHS